MSVQGVAIQLWACNVLQPDLLSTPFFDAAALAAFDVPVELYFTARSVELLKPGVAEALFSGPQRNKSVYAYMQEAAQHGAKFYACTDAVRVYGLEGQPLIPEYTAPGGVVQFAARLLDARWRCLVF